MGVHEHALEHLPAPPGDLDDRGEPGFVRQELHGLHRHGLGRKPDPPDMGDVQKGVAEHLDVRRLQSCNVAARNDDVLDGGVGADIVQRRRPTVGTGDVVLLQGGRVLAYGIAARAVLAVDGADGGNEEEHLVGIAMHEVWRRRRVPLLEGIDRHAGMIGLEFREHRQELPANGIGFRIAPVDQVHDVRIEPYRHADLFQAVANFVEDAGRHLVAHESLELLDTDDGVLVLPGVVKKIFPGRRGVKPGRTLEPKDVVEGHGAAPYQMRTRPNDFAIPRPELSWSGPELY